MDHTQGQGSEVARLLAQIRAEYEVAQLGLTGLAQGIGQHTFITKRMENIGTFHEELKALVGDAAMELVVQQLSDLPDASRSSA
jgi:hypothetical protein